MRYTLTNKAIAIFLSIILLIGSAAAFAEVINGEYAFEVIGEVDDTPVQPAVYPPERGNRDGEGIPATDIITSEEPVLYPTEKEDDPEPYGPPIPDDYPLYVDGGREKNGPAREAGYGYEPQFADELNRNRSRAGYLDEFTLEQEVYLEYNARDITFHFAGSGIDTGPFGLFAINLDTPGRITTGTSLPSGTRVQITALPYTPGHIASWSVNSRPVLGVPGGDGEETSITVVVAENANDVYVSFEQVYPTVHYRAVDSEINGGLIQVGNTAGEGTPRAYGTREDSHPTLHFIATLPVDPPDARWHVNEWRINDSLVTAGIFNFGSGTRNHFQLSNFPSNPINVTVSFIQGYEVTFAVAGDSLHAALENTSGLFARVTYGRPPTGSIESGRVRYDGDVIEFSAVPDPGFRVRGWSITENDGDTKFHYPDPYPDDNLNTLRRTLSADLDVQVHFAEALSLTPSSVRVTTYEDDPHDDRDTATAEIGGLARGPITIRQGLDWPTWASRYIEYELVEDDGCYSIEIRIVRRPRHNELPITNGVFTLRVEREDVYKYLTVTAFIEPAPPPSFILDQNPVIITTLDAHYVTATGEPGRPIAGGPITVVGDVVNGSNVLDEDRHVPVFPASGSIYVEYVGGDEIRVTVTNLTRYQNGSYFVSLIRDHVVRELEIVLLLPHVIFSPNTASITNALPSTAPITIKGTQAGRITAGLPSGVSISSVVDLAGEVCYNDETSTGYRRIVISGDRAAITRAIIYTYPADPLPVNIYRDPRMPTPPDPMPALNNPLYLDIYLTPLPRITSIEPETSLIEVADDYDGTVDAVFNITGQHFGYEYNWGEVGRSFRHELLVLAESPDWPNFVTIGAIGDIERKSDTSATVTVTLAITPNTGATRKGSVTLNTNLPNNPYGPPESDYRSGTLEIHQLAPPPSIISIEPTAETTGLFSNISHEGLLTPIYAVFDVVGTNLHLNQADLRHGDRYNFTVAITGLTPPGWILATGEPVVDDITLNGHFDDVSGRRYDTATVTIPLTVAPNNDIARNNFAEPIIIINDMTPAITGNLRINQLAPPLSITRITPTSETETAFSSVEHGDGNPIPILARFLIEGDGIRVNRFDLPRYFNDIDANHNLPDWITISDQISGQFSICHTYEVTPTSAVLVVELIVAPNNTGPREGTVTIHNTRPNSSQAYGELEVIQVAPPPTIESITPTLLTLNTFQHDPRISYRGIPPTFAEFSVVGDNLTWRPGHEDTIGAGDFAVAAGLPYWIEPGTIAVTVTSRTTATVRVPLAVLENGGGPREHTMTVTNTINTARTGSLQIRQANAPFRITSIGPAPGIVERFENVAYGGGVAIEIDAVFNVEGTNFIGMPLNTSGIDFDVESPEWIDEISISVGDRTEMTATLTVRLSVRSNNATGADLRSGRIIVSVDTENSAAENPIADSYTLYVSQYGPPTVTGVIVRPDPDPDPDGPAPVYVYVVQGGHQYFTAAVEGRFDPPQGVEWSIDSSSTTSSETSITGTPDGARLTIGGDETVPGSFTVRATSTHNRNISGTVTVHVAIEPTIYDGPDGMPLRVGYSAKESEAFIIRGVPDPDIELSFKVGSEVVNDVPEITWNRGERKLDIAEGLDPGIYTVTLTAENILGKSDPHTFTLTVWKPPAFYPLPTAASIEFGTHDGYIQFGLEGFPQPDVKLDVSPNPSTPIPQPPPEPPQIDWDSRNNRLIIAPDLAAGTYTITLTATVYVNDIPVYPVATHDFILTVNPAPEGVLPLGFELPEEAPYIIFGQTLADSTLPPDTEFGSFAWTAANPEDVRPYVTRENDDIIGNPISRRHSVTFTPSEPYATNFTWNNPHTSPVSHIFDVYLMVRPRNIEHATVTIIDPQELIFTGNPITPRANQIRVNVPNFVPNSGYISESDIGAFNISASYNIDANTSAVVTVRGTGNFKGTATEYFTIHPAPGGPLGFTWPTEASAITFRQRLGDSTLTGGSTHGSFTWTDPQYEPTVSRVNSIPAGTGAWQSQYFQATFTPSEHYATNYTWENIPSTKYFPVMVRPHLVSGAPLVTATLDGSALLGDGVRLAEGHILVADLSEIDGFPNNLGVVQWFIGRSDTPALTTDPTGRTFRVPDDNLAPQGSKITARVSGIHNFTGTTERSTPMTVDSIPIRGDIHILGERTLGSELSLDRTYPHLIPTDATVTYRWLRCDGTELGANETHRITYADLTNTITLEIRGSGIFTGGPLSANIVIPAGPPSVPENFLATPGNTIATLSWTVPQFDGFGGDADLRYEVSRDGQTWIPADSDTGHIFTELTNGTLYTFWVRAVNDFGPGAHRTVTAQPVAPRFSVTIENEPRLSGGANPYRQTPTGQTFRVGETVTLNAGERAGFVFNNWSSDSQLVRFADPSDANTSFMMPQGNVTVTANWTQLFSVTILNSPNGASVPFRQSDSVRTFEAGMLVSLEAGTRDGFAFSDWGTNSQMVVFNSANSASTRFTMPPTNVIITANWAHLAPPLPTPPSTATPTYDDPYPPPDDESDTGGTTDEDDGTDYGDEVDPGDGTGSGGDTSAAGPGDDASNPSDDATSGARLREWLSRNLWWVSLHLAALGAIAAWWWFMIWRRRKKKEDNATASA